MTTVTAHRAQLRSVLPRLLLAFCACVHSAGEPLNRAPPASTSWSGAWAHCHDNLQDGDETGVDCGGVCKPCNGGQNCVSGADCKSRRCVGNVCKDAHGLQKKLAERAPDKRACRALVAECTKYGSTRCDNLLGKCGAWALAGHCVTKPETMLMACRR